MIWWRDKVVKDQVKQARRAKRDMVGMVDDSLNNMVDDMVDIVDMIWWSTLRTTWWTTSRTTWWTWWPTS